MEKSEKIVLFDIDYTLFDTAIFKKSNRHQYVIYDEVLQTLQDLQKIAKLGIFSEGVLKFQQKKLTRTAITHLFHTEHIHIVERKSDVIESVFSLYKDHKIYLVDDKLTILRDAKKFLPSLYVIWVKRGYYAEKQKPLKDFTPDAVVNNLRDVGNIILHHVNPKSEARNSKQYQNSNDKN
jgi:FMN phosphatase YigB (HAD superfamily)